MTGATERENAEVEKKEMTKDWRSWRRFCLFSFCQISLDDFMYSLVFMILMYSWSFWNAQKLWFSHAVSSAWNSIHLANSWAFLVAQTVKNPPAMQETWVWSLGWEAPWRRERLPTPVFWPGEFHGLCSPWDLQRVRHDWATFTFTFLADS